MLSYTWISQISLDDPVSELSQDGAKPAYWSAKDGWDHHKLAQRHLATVWELEHGKISDWFISPWLRVRLALSRKIVQLEMR